MVRYTSSSLVLLAAISSSLAQQQTILVGFSSHDGYNAVVEHTASPGAGASANILNGPKMFRRPRQVGRKRRGRRRRFGRNGANGNAPDPTEPSEPEPEMTIGYAKVDFTGADIEGEIEALSKIPGVTIAELDGEVQALGFPTNEKEGKSSLRGQMERFLQGQSQPWGIGKVNVTDFWPGGSKEPDMPRVKKTMCIIDTGYDITHEDLPKGSDGVTGFTPSDGGPGTDFGVWDVDGSGHGTHVAGTIGAIGNSIGVVGVFPDTSMFTYRIGKGLGDNGFGSYSGIQECVEDCVANGASVISMSLGGSGSSSFMEAALEAAYDDGVLVIAAAGNSGDERYSYPASYDVVMSVASVTEGGPLSSFSTRSDQQEIAAPGSDVLSTTPGNEYEFYSGTSMATPHVSAVAMYLRSYFPDCEPNQIRNAMLNSVSEPPRPVKSWDIEYGYGNVNFGAAYELLKSDGGCEYAGGLSSTAAGMTPSEMAQGGAYQKDIGCTEDFHCFIGPNFGTRVCDVSTNTCAVVPGTAPTPAPTAPCDGVKITLEFKTDNYPSETSWTLSQECGSGFSESSEGYTKSNTVYIDNFCTSDGEFTFTINDTWGDGVVSPGYYKIYKDDVEIVSEGPPIFDGTRYEKKFGSCGGTPPTNPPPATASPTNQPTSISTSNPTNQPSPAPVPVTASPTPAPVPPVTASPSPGSSCNGSELKVDVFTDRFPSETSYVIRDMCDNGNEMYRKEDFVDESLNSETYCVPDGEYEFEIFDSYGDGICCNYGIGNYTVHMDGEMKAQGGAFQDSESATFGSCGGNSTPAPTTTRNPRPSTPAPTTSTPTTSTPTTSTPTTASPTTASPTTANPTTANPTSQPSSNPTANPTTADPTKNPTPSPTTPEPTKNPTIEPTPSPSTTPTKLPTSDPTSQPSPPPVTPTDTTIKVALTLDNYPGETSWSIMDTCKGGEIIASGSSYSVGGEEVSVEVTVPPSRFMLVILDTFGDGMCCDHGQGGYDVYQDDVMIVSGGDFGAMESHYFGECSDGPQTSKPTGEPTTIATPPPSASAPAPASFDTLTPACNVAQSICSTNGTDLLEYKGLGESNGPNTLDGCVDGGSGTHLSDESVEAVTVVATDSAGNPIEGVLSAGGYAKIKAKVYSYSATNSYVDFFKTSDVTNPTWEALNDGSSAIGVEKGLVDVESNTFQLSNTAEMQAVRVAIRFIGTQSPCSPGDWDERDDLKFKVDMSTAADAVMVAVAPPVTASPPESQAVSDCSAIVEKERCQFATGCYWGRSNEFATRNRMRRNKKSCHAFSS